MEKIKKSKNIIKKTKKYFVYIIRCEQNMLYTGITTDVKRRFEEHCGKRSGGAKFTKRYKPKKIELVYSAKDRKDASKLEYYIKKLKKEDKENLILKVVKLKNIINKKIDIKKYKRIV